MKRLSQRKPEARQQAKSIRHTLASKIPTSEIAASKTVEFSLIENFPSSLEQRVIAGFSPIGDEIDIWPLLKTLHQEDRRISLPVVMGANQALSFRQWTPGCDMNTDQFGVSYPAEGESLNPQLVFIPLLAFTTRGERLGYGGGYYDRTLASLRAQGDVFACGVAYAGQEVEFLPTDDHDERLDGILTEDGFRLV